MSRFAFYQEVRIVRPHPHNLDCRGQCGAIVGLAEAPDEPAGYAVAIAGRTQIAICEEDELEATGRQFRREDFYDDNQSFRVRVDPDGRGHPA